MLTFIKMGKKQYVDLGLVTLVSVLIVVVIFVVMKCKLTCGGNRENYDRISWANDTSGSAYGYLSPVDFAGPSDVNISIKDSPHFKADVGNWYLPLEVAQTDMQRGLRRLSMNYTINPDNPLNPIGEEFSQNYVGKRAMIDGKPSVGNPWVSNTTNVRDDFVGRGDLSAWDSLDYQIQQGHVMKHGMDYPQRLDVRKFNVLSSAKDSPNAQAVPALAKYNKQMNDAIEYNLDVSL